MSDQTEGQVMEDCHQTNKPMSDRKISNEFDSKQPMRARQIWNKFDSNQPMRARQIWNEFDSGGEDS